MHKAQSRAAAWLAGLLAARGKRVVAWAVAVVATWTANIALAVKNIIPPECHGFVDAGTAVLTTLTGTWLLLAYFWDKLKAAEQARRDEEEKERYKAAERAVRDTIIAMHGDECVLNERPDWLRAV